MIMREWEDNVIREMIMSSASTCDLEDELLLAEVNLSDVKRFCEKYG